MHEIIETIIDAIPNYRIDNLPERSNGMLLKKTDLTMKKNKDVMKNLKITQIKSKSRCASLLKLTNLFVNTKAYPFISLGTTPSNLNSTLID